MNLTFAPQAWEDYSFWQLTDPKMVTRINLLIKDIMRSPHSGIGKPEPLRHAFRGYWSRGRRRHSYRAGSLPLQRMSTISIRFRDLAKKHVKLDESTRCKPDDGPKETYARLLAKQSDLTKRLHAAGYL